MPEQRESQNKLCQGQVIIRETNCSIGPEEIFYLKPEGQSNIIAYKPIRKKGINYKEFCAKLFLPAGFPDSVSKDYLAYQIWDSAQAFCSTITGTLATHEVLKGVGVGNVQASPLAATITWVIKDGSGHIGRILFAATHGPLLDAYSKKWRLYADTLNDAAMCIEIALPLFKNYTLFALCVSSGMKAIVGVAGGATRAALTQHHAISGNMADVAAKDSAQETAVNLVASFAAIFAIAVFGNSLILFFLMMTLHIVCNYLAVRAICLRTLNEPRFLQLIDKYLRKEVIETPCLINKEETLISFQLGPDRLDLKMIGFRIKTGRSLKHLLEQNRDSERLSSVIEVYEDFNYIVYPNVGTREMCIFMDINATTTDVLCAYFHAVLLSIATCAINNVTLPVVAKGDYTPPFASVCDVLKKAEWSKIYDKDLAVSSDFDYQPSFATLMYIVKITKNEWPRIKKGLSFTGWDLTKHLLVSEGWHYTLNDVSFTEISPSTSLENDAKYKQITKKKDSKETTYPIQTGIKLLVDVDSVDGKVTIKNPLEAQELDKMSTESSASVASRAKQE